MTHPHDRKAEIDREARRRQIAAVLLSGARVNQKTLAEQFDVDQSTISRDIKAIEDSWRQQAAADIATAKGHDLQRIERLIAALWQQATSQGVSQADAIGQIRQLLQRKAAMLGYDAPKKVEGKFDITTQRAAERVAAELGLSVEEVLEEADRVLKGVAA